MHADFVSCLCTAKNQYRKCETNIPRKGFARPQSQFQHSCVCERWSICLFCCRDYVDRSWECINRSQTYERGNWDWGRQIPRKRLNKWDFRCSVCIVLVITQSFGNKWSKCTIWKQQNTRWFDWVCKHLCLEYLHTIGDTSQCLCFSYSHGFFHFKWWLLTSCFSAYTARF